MRFEPIKTPSDFSDSPTGMEKLDSICMLLIAIGESIKKIDKISNNELLIKYPEVNWKGIKGIRDIISHHYFDIDSEEIFWICSKELKSFRTTIEIIINDLNNL